VPLYSLNVKDVVDFAWLDLELDTEKMIEELSKFKKLFE